MLTKAIFLFDGSKILLMESEFKDISKKILSGSEVIIAGENLINVKNIARVGDHESTAYMKTLARATTENDLRIAGKNKVLETRKEQERIKAINVYLKKQKMDMLEYEEETRKMIEKAEDPQFYLKDGEKYYS